MLTNYLRNCQPRFAGVNPSIFIGEASKAWDITFSGNTITAIVSDETPAEKMQEFQAEPHTVSFGSEGEWGNSGFETQTITARFGKASDALDTAVKNLKKSLVCGVFVIYIDNNKKGWLVGLAPTNEDFYNDYFRKLTTNFNTGESVEDVDEGDTLFVELSRESATGKYPLATALVNTILAKDAAFINYATSE